MVVITTVTTTCYVGAAVHVEVALHSCIANILTVYIFVKRYAVYVTHITTISYASRVSLLTLLAFKIFQSENPMPIHLSVP